MTCGRGRARRWVTGMRRRIPVTAVMAVAVVTAAVLQGACAAGGRASPAVPSNLPASGVPASSAASPPPVAVIAGLDRADAFGDLGSYTWDGLSSESPWIVGATAGDAHPGAGLEIVLTPAWGLSRWQALWAPVTGTEVGTPIDAGGGEETGGTLRVLAPPDPGPWSLALTADFGQGRNATWYWRIEVRP
jgi:hypothetical protein